jgi:FkbM family methyltransferase
MLARIAAHAKRISLHLGGGVTIGRERFKVQGYHASRLNTSAGHEPFLADVVRQLLESRPGAFVDVGVNVGQTLMKVLSVGRDRAYVGFEPQIGCCYFVDQFLRLNGLRNAMVLPIGLSDSNRILTLYSSGQYDEMASIAGTDDVTGKRRPDATHVQTRIGDEVLRELGVGAISAVKIDVEGAELQVLAGLKETLREKRPPVIFEVLPNFYGHERIMQPPDVRARNQATADAVYALLQGVGYDVFQLADASAGETKIARFELDDREGFVGGNFLARARGTT